MQVDRCQLLKEGEQGYVGMHLCVGMIYQLRERSRYRVVYGVEMSTVITII